MNISIIIPAYNEEHFLPITLKSLLQNPFWHELIIVDDGSTDGTKDIEIPKLAKLIRHKQNMGKGKAIETGIKASQGDILMFLDADLGETALFADQLLSPVINENVHMTIAKFPQSNKKGGFGIVKSMARYGIYRLTGLYVEEPLSGQRCIRREVIGVIKNFHVGFGFEVALTLDVIRAGYTFKEVAIPFQHRELGRTLKGFYHRGKEMTQIAKTLWIKRA